MGWNFRKYQGTLIIKSSRDSVKNLLKKIKGRLDANKTTKTHVVIAKLNPTTRGWANYHQETVVKKTFSHMTERV